MNTAEPIRNKEDLAHIKDYYKITRPNTRNYLFIIIGLNTALRVSDIIQMKWQDVFDFYTDSVKNHITLMEQKTGKTSVIFLNNSVKQAIQNYKQTFINDVPALAGNYLFGSYGQGNTHISRVQAFRIVKQAAQACGIEGVISCHSLRKTFGYYAWKQGVQPVMLMNIFNHSSFRITQRYLGIAQDDRDRIFRDIEL